MEVKNETLESFCKWGKCITQFSRKSDTEKHEVITNTISKIIQTTDVHTNHRQLITLKVIEKFLPQDILTSHAFNIDFHLKNLGNHQQSLIEKLICELLAQKTAIEMNKYCEETVVHYCKLIRANKVDEACLVIHQLGIALHYSNAHEKYHTYNTQSILNKLKEETDSLLPSASKIIYDHIKIYQSDTDVILSDSTQNVLKKTAQ